MNELCPVVWSVCMCVHMASAANPTFIHFIIFTWYIAPIQQKRRGCECKNQHIFKNNSIQKYHLDKLKVL